jgi:atypical dual specificity phosphatase
MLSFPTPSWQTAVVANLRSTSNHSDPRYGRAATLILPRLYLSDFFTARDETEMTKLGITHMVSVMEHTPTTMPDVVRHIVPIADRWNADILNHLDGTTEFIRSALAENEENRVLVGWIQRLCECRYFIEASLI